MLGSAEDRLLMPEVRDTNERLIIGVLDEGLDDGERPVVREHPVTRLQGLDRPRPVGGVHRSSGWEAADTGSPRCFLPEFRNVGVAGWNRPSMISSTSFSARPVSPAASVSATITTRSSKRSR